MSKNEKANNGQGSPPVRVKVTPESEKGIYSNVVNINASKNEVVFDFIFLPPQTKEATLVSRVVLSRAHAEVFLGVFKHLLERAKK